MFKFPWLQSRKKILFLTFIDTSIFTFLYIKIIQYFEIEFFFSFFVPSILLLALVNYILGRYSEIENINSIYRRDLFNVVIAFFILVLIYSASINLFFDKMFIDTIFLKLIELIFFQQILSLLFHFLVKNYLLKNIEIIKKWNVIGSEVKFNYLLNEVNISNYKTSLNHDQIKPLFSLKNPKSSNSGLIILEPEKITSKEHDILVAAYGSSLRVMDVLRWSEIYLQRLPISFLGSSQIIMRKFLKSTNSIQYRIKRTFDVIIAFLIILFTLPIVILCSLFIFLEDRGPILYQQKRTGLNNKKFTIYKLRTMKVNAESNGAQWSKKNDNRITFVGKFLRKTRIDELPQLFCVINSDMSLIGPRPERPEIDAYLEQNIENYNLRYKIKPGLSGWAQVNYPYGASLDDSKNKLSYDLYYMKNFNLFLDLLIFFKTLRLILNASGAIAKG